MGESSVMKVLALDTTTRGGSVAIVDDDRVIDQRGGDHARTHAERLPGELLTIAAASQTPLASVDVFASDQLDVTVSGAANVTYSGDAKVNKHVSGAGSITKKESRGV